MTVTFKEKFNLTDNMSHTEKYDTIIDGLGYEAVKQYIPVNRNRIIEALKTDEHLNNININIWDRAAGYEMRISKDRRMIPVPFGCFNLKSYCIQQGVNCMSPAELVCILKRCAVRWANEPQNEKE